MNNILIFKPKKSVKKCNDKKIYKNNILKFKINKPKRNKAQTQLDSSFNKVCYIMDNYKEKHDCDEFFLEISSSVDQLKKIKDHFLTDEELELKADLTDNLIFVLEYSIKQERLAQLQLIKCG